MCTLHEQRAQHAVARSRDAQLLIDVTRQVAMRHEPDVRPDLAAPPPALWGLDRQHVAQRGQRTDAGYLREPLGLGVAPLARMLDLRIQARDLVAASARVVTSPKGLDANRRRASFRIRRRSSARAAAVIRIGPSEVTALTSAAPRGASRSPSERASTRTWCLPGADGDGTRRWPAAGRRR